MGETTMPLDGSAFDEGSHGQRWCRACKEPIAKEQRVTRVEFRNDPHGFKGLTGDYHATCSKPFASLAHVINMNPWAGR